MAAMKSPAPARPSSSARLLVAGAECDDACEEGPEALVTGAPPRNEQPPGGALPLPLGLSSPKIGRASCRERVSIDMSIGDWSSDVCSSDLLRRRPRSARHRGAAAK